MNERILQRIKQFLTIIGSYIPPNKLYRLQQSLNYMKLGGWMRKNNFFINTRLPDRKAVFNTVAELVKDKEVLYLEFGVFKGESMRFWSDALKHPDSKLIGFDSFEGLPEDFDVEGNFIKGTFNVNGVIPKIDDPRVKFFKGWFDEVLPKFQLPEHKLLIIVMDADLYSSTNYVLNYLAPYIKPGTFIYFDDMSHPEHEPRAFEEFIKKSGIKFRLIATDYSLNNAFFQCIE